MRRPFRRRRPDAPLDCREVRALMQAFLDGEVDEADATLVRDHLHRCAACGVEAAVYERVRAAVAGLRTPSDPDAIARLRATVDELTGA